MGPCSRSSPAPLVRRQVVHAPEMFLEAAILWATLLALGYWWLCGKWKYWEEQGIPGPTPSLPAGNFGPIMSMKMHILDVFRDLYHQFPGEKVIGIYTIHQPAMVVNDPDMARQILVKDFNHFVDRDTEENMSRAFPGKIDAYWLEQMTIKTGEKWKDIRSTFSPIFTSGKMKAMVRFIDKVSDSLVQHMDNNTAMSEGFELKDSMGKFSLDTLASCAFGVDGQSFEDKESVFVNNASRIFTNTKMDQFKIFGAMLLPGLAKNPDLQRRLQEEVDAAYEASGGKTPDYNDIQGFTFLDQLIQESLRLHSVIVLQRVVTSPEYTLPGTSTKMKKGSMVFINSPGIHSDPKYFPNPTVFNPDNFSKEAKASRSPYTFLGFGQGPRACVGMRFAMLEAKMALVKIFRHFTFVRVGRTVEKATSDPASGLGYAKEGLYVRVIRRTEE